MKRFKEFIRETWLTPFQATKLNSKEFANVGPAIKHKKTKELHIGKPGTYHGELTIKTKYPKMTAWHRGFWKND